jgi:hypothetical protein
VFRAALVPVLVLLALALRVDVAWAQRSARARVSVAIAPPPIPAETLDRVISLVVGGSRGAADRLLPAGARLVLSESPRLAPGSARPATATLALPTRRITLLYAAN